YRPEEFCWLRSAQIFVATVVTLLLHRHVRQFRYFLHVTTGCALILLLTATSYPFEPYRLLLTFIWVVVGSVVVIGLWIFVQMDRNAVMSHIAGTAPNHVTFNVAFLMRIVTFALIPLLSLAAAQYPQVADFLYKFVAPFTRALH
ncbi:MAG TPA: hypothetical protein VGK73_04700, partial [Polyangiaceae bacterium]